MTTWPTAAAVFSNAAVVFAAAQACCALSVRRAYLKSVAWMKLHHQDPNMELEHSNASGRRSKQMKLEERVIPVKENERLMRFMPLLQV
eukprot:CAMPEP_0172745234 /NCGR_PEP_ID=MMETSP1074-20121228/137417_1 /TAXON_ID=2916 /ORGANISM="Ceratium fusus, Strain PA161109" /LENGTH=88 /DNA_ID=CAMNT_0013576353 /DNA_START=363 /DNA_END=631 /DNA_ORIENTATION=-